MVALPVEVWWLGTGVEGVMKGCISNQEMCNALCLVCLFEGMVLPFEGAVWRLGM